jgi:murein DD-endopeptidase MepM/ murein hydrolase activator NlpD
VLTAGFGNRIDPFNGRPEFHTGIDISTPAGNRIVAPANGTVVRVGWENGYGRFVEISHGYGVNTTYGHLATARVIEGQRVKRGDVIALVGSTGRSTGPHLHYEVHAAGKTVNPLDFILNAF